MKSKEELIELVENLRWHASYESGETLKLMYEAARTIESFIDESESKTEEKVKQG